VQIPSGNRSQPEAIGAVVEVTKWLKPSISVSRIGDSASVQAANASERRASSEKDDVYADPTAISGKAEMAGRVERRIRPAAAPGYWRRHVHKERVGGRVQPLQEPDTGNIDAPFFSTLGRFLDPFNALESALGNRAPLE
jgi:hypothetical protein